MTKNQKEADHKWAHKQIKQYRHVFPRYKLYAKTLQNVLEKASNKYAPLAIVQVRPKAIASFAEKIQRKKNKYNDPVNQITDLCGARVITHTQTEVKAVSEFIEKRFEIDWENSIDVSQRLKPTEFGYRSIHYIVKFKPSTFPTKDIDVIIPEKVFGMKAEIQVRTILEHAWADITHDMSYKGAFQIPDKWVRELAVLAATLEATDNAFSRIHSGLKSYSSSYGSYMSKEQMINEIDLLKIVLEYDTEKQKVAQQIGKLLITIGDWQKAIDILSKYKHIDYPPLLRDLGIAMCKLHKKEPDCKEYLEGQKYLETACAHSNKDIDALSSLAGTWKEIDENKAKSLYREAFEIDPSDPYPLGNYLEYDLAYRKETSLILLLKPVINAAIKRCCDQVDVNMNIPWAFYDMGKFYLLLSQPYNSLAAYAKAIQLSTDEWMVKTSLRSIDSLAVVREMLPGYDWVKRLLMVGWAVKFSNEYAIEQVKKMESIDHEPIQGYVVIVTGVLDVGTEQQMQDFIQIMLEAFRDFKGTIISSCPNTGIGSMIGVVQEKYQKSIRTIVYSTKSTPLDMNLNKQYSEIRYTNGNELTALDSLQCWIDLIASGIHPSKVKLMGINGSSLNVAEYKIALALGARVAIVQESGNEIAKLLSDDDWSHSVNLLHLPKDGMELRAFIGSGCSKLAPNLRETIAQAIHAAYKESQMSYKRSKDPSLADWNALLDYLKESNRQQADHIIERLLKIGCNIRKVQGRNIRLITFTKNEIEIMAEMEHARWNEERLLDGWKLGQERDVTKKISPYLMPWSELPEAVKELDRETVRKISEFLAKVGLEVYRK